MEWLNAAAAQSRRGGPRAAANSILRVMDRGLTDWERRSMSKTRPYAEKEEVVEFYRTPLPLVAGHTPPRVPGVGVGRLAALRQWARERWAVAEVEIGEDEDVPLLGPVDEKTVTLMGDEAHAMDHLLKAAQIIFGWKPIGNHAELGTAIHVMQGFIVQHMLHRLNPDHWNSWYGEQDG